MRRPRSYIVSGPDPQFARSAQRRVNLAKTDRVFYNGYEIDVAVLEAITKPEARVLWAFLAHEDGKVQPVPYDETHCVWLQDSDLVREDD